MNEAMRIEYNDTQQDSQYGYEEGTVLIVHRYERYFTLETTHYMYTYHH
jgi:hypothetical protein